MHKFHSKISLNDKLKTLSMKFVVKDYPAVLKFNNFMKKTLNQG